MSKMNVQHWDQVLALWNEATAPLADPAPEKKPKKRRVGASSELTTAVEKPSCRPWNHADFLQRVATFQIGAWLTKPDVIGVYQCARHGWKNTTEDYLYCASCEKTLCFTIDSTLSKQGVQAVAGVFATQLINGHDALCPWRDNPSPESFMMLPVATPKQVLTALQRKLQRLMALVKKKDAWKQALKNLTINSKALDQIGIEACGESSELIESTNKRVYDQLVSTNSLEDNTTDQSVAVHAALLIICGWEQSDEVNVMQCAYCNREIGLWNFALVSETAAHEQEGKKPLDPMAQHRWFCPWIATPAANSQERKALADTMKEHALEIPVNTELWEFIQQPGWEQYAQALHINSTLDAATVKTTMLKPEEALERIRSVLGISDF